ncbi:hypothetical protein D9613_002932 [Agrocybe pediades]|uniref:Mitochondrial carrier protein n=1 Tax=Agrocybe pediades TaxID=84607 RepID=A0A8H4VME5_9AGAR|nr:hypothetical protein D9613_002932 [Agrocybe pediades]
MTIGTAKFVWIAENPSNGGIQAAIARTASRSLALYFSRPVRLFRPSKVNGWHTLKNLAIQQGTTLSYQYITSLVKTRGILVIPKHFIPPMIINASLGLVLWNTYGEANTILQPSLMNHNIWNAAISGAIAGACQALAAAPAENVRILLEHGFGGHSWSCAWKEVFREKSVGSPPHSNTNLQEIRHLRGWLQEVGQMAGRGWHGWRWGLGKDTIGFSAFFTIFELSRRAGSAAKTYTTDLLATMTSISDTDRLIYRRMPAIVNGAVLVTGGVVAGVTYEFVGRPWDWARRTIHIGRVPTPKVQQPPLLVIRQKIHQDGVLSLFQNPAVSTRPAESSAFRWDRVVRAAGRVGPWGVGFLVWEAYGPGLA